MTRPAIAACGAVALGATLYVGRNSPPFVTVLIAGWVVAPFLPLLLASERRGSVLFSIACAIVYIARAVAAPDSSRAFVFVAVPAVSWIVVAAILLATRSSSRE